MNPLCLSVIGLGCLLIIGCGLRGGGDAGTQAFLAAGGDSAAVAQQPFPEVLRFAPLIASIAYVEDQRRGETTVTLENTSAQPLVLAEITPHCRSCRITESLPRQLPAGESLTIPVQVDLARLERLPSQRFIEVVALSPDDQVYQHLIKIVLHAAASPAQE